MQHQAVGPGPLSAAAAWRESYSQAGAQAAHAAPDWRPRSPRTALWFCAATLVGGFGVLYLALLSHEWLAGGHSVLVCLWGSCRLESRWRRQPGAAPQRLNGRSPLAAPPAGYTWLTPSEVDKRRRHPTPQRQKLAQLMMQPRKPPEEQ